MLRILLRLLPLIGLIAVHGASMQDDSRQGPGRPKKLLSERKLGKDAHRRKLDSFWPNTNGNQEGDPFSHYDDVELRKRMFRVCEDLAKGIKKKCRPTMSKKPRGPRKQCSRELKKVFRILHCDERTAPPTHAPTPSPTPGPTPAPTVALECIRNLKAPIDQMYDATTGNRPRCSDYTKSDRDGSCKAHYHYQNYLSNANHPTKNAYIYAYEICPQCGLCRLGT